MVIYTSPELMVLVETFMEMVELMASLVFLILPIVVKFMFMLKILVELIIIF
jgi:hypothetical protein